MSLGTPTDYYSLADGTKLAVKEDNQNASATNVEAPANDVGDIPANEVLATLLKPDCGYEMLDAWGRGAETPTANPIKLGKVTEVSDHSFVLTEFSISTRAGSPPVIKAKGEQVEDDATDGDYYAIPAFALALVHRALCLWNAFTVGGTGCHFTSADYTASVKLSPGTLNGGVVSHDVSEGAIVCKLNLCQTGNTEPTVTPGTNWQIVEPLTKVKTDAQYPTWTCGLKMYLTKTRTDANASSGSGS